MDDSIPAQLIMLVGAGTNWKICEPQEQAFGEAFICPDWIEPISDDESLASYAKRLADQIRPTLDGERPHFLAGMSLGGFFAREMAQHLEPKAILLVSSCQSRLGMRAIIRRMAWLESRLPLQLRRAMNPPAVRIVAMREGLDRQQRGLMRDSMLEGNLRARKWSERIILHSGDDTSNRSLPQPIHLIIGDRDPFIPISAVQPDEIVQGGRHLITLTHGSRVNSFLRQYMDRYL